MTSPPRRGTARHLSLWVWACFPERRRPRTLGSPHRLRYEKFEPGDLAKRLCVTSRSRTGYAAREPTHLGDFRVRPSTGQSHPLRPAPARPIDATDVDTSPQLAREPWERSVYKHLHLTSHVHTCKAPSRLAPHTCFWPPRMLGVNAASQSMAVWSLPHRARARWCQVDTKRERPRSNRPQNFRILQVDHWNDALLHPSSRIFQGTSRPPQRARLAPLARASLKTRDTKRAVPP